MPLKQPKLWKKYNYHTRWCSLCLAVTAAIYIFAVCTGKEQEGYHSWGTQGGYSDFRGYVTCQERRQRKTEKLQKQYGWSDKIQSIHSIRFSGINSTAFDIFSSHYVNTLLQFVSVEEQELSLSSQKFHKLKHKWDFSFTSRMKQSWLEQPLEKNSLSCATREKKAHTKLSYNTTKFKFS